MKTCYIGRIRLSNEDSKEWGGNPPFMYVTKSVDRTNINKATMFNSKEECIVALVDSFKSHKHLPSSKMEIMKISIYVDNIEQL
jgi:hypothetical protein